MYNLIYNENIYPYIVQNGTYTVKIGCYTDEIPTHQMLNYLENSHIDFGSLHFDFHVRQIGEKSLFSAFNHVPLTPSSKGLYSNKEDNQYFLFTYLLNNKIYCDEYPILFTINDLYTKKDKEYFFELLFENLNSTCSTIQDESNLSLLYFNLNTCILIDLGYKHTVINIFVDKIKIRTKIYENNFNGFYVWSKI